MAQGSEQLSKWYDFSECKYLNLAAGSNGSGCQHRSGPHSPYDLYVGERTICRGVKEG